MDRGDNIEVSPSDPVPLALIEHLVESACFEVGEVVEGDFVPGDLFISGVGGHFGSVVIVHLHLFGGGG